MDRSVRDRVLCVRRPAHHRADGRPSVEVAADPPLPTWSGLALHLAFPCRAARRSARAGTAGSLAWHLRDGATSWTGIPPAGRSASAPRATSVTCAISPDGRWAATGSHSRRWGEGLVLPEGKPVHQDATRRTTSQALFSPDGRRLASTRGPLPRPHHGRWSGGPLASGRGLAFSPEAASCSSATPRAPSGSSSRHRPAGRDPGGPQLQQRPVCRRHPGRLPLRDDQRGQPRRPRLGPADDPRSALRARSGLGLAVAQSARFTARSADRLRLLTNLGQADAFRPNGDSNESVARLTGELESEPESVELWMRRGWLFVQLGRLDRAIDDFTKALSLWPEDPEVLAARGRIQLEREYFTEGVADLEASIALSPDQPLARNDLAWAYATAPLPTRNLAKALAHAQLAVQLDPRTASHHNTLGVVLTRLGRFGEAIAELEKSLRSASRVDSVYDLYVLSQCHHHIGGVGEAKVNYERALRIHTESQFTARASRELDGFRADTEALYLAGGPSQVIHRDDGTLACRSGAGTGLRIQRSGASSPRAADIVIGGQPAASVDLARGPADFDRLDRGRATKPKWSRGSPAD